MWLLVLSCTSGTPRPVFSSTTLMAKYSLAPCSAEESSSRLTIPRIIRFILHPGLAARSGTRTCRRLGRFRSSRGLPAATLPLSPGRFQLSISLSMDLLLPPRQHVLRRDVADGTVQTDVVVVLDVALHQTPRIFQRQWRSRPDALSFERFVPPFDLAVRLGIVGRSSDVGHARDPNELLEVLGDELRPVIRDDPWLGCKLCSLDCHLWGSQQFANVAEPQRVWDVNCLPFERQRPNLAVLAEHRLFDAGGPTVVFREDGGDSAQHIVRIIPEPIELRHGQHDASVSRPEIGR